MILNENGQCKRHLKGLSKIIFCLKNHFFSYQNLHSEITSIPLIHLEKSFIGCVRQDRLNLVQQQVTCPPPNLRGVKDKSVFLIYCKVQWELTGGSAPQRHSWTLADRDSVSTSASVVVWAEDTDRTNHPPILLWQGLVKYSLWVKSDLSSVFVHSTGQEDTYILNHIFYWLKKIKRITFWGYIKIIWI